MRQVLIGLMIILMLRFRPEGVFRERPGLDTERKPTRQLPSGAVGALAPAATGNPGVPEGQAADDGGSE
jgi:hypothetical protein